MPVTISAVEYKHVSDTAEYHTPDCVTNRFLLMTGKEFQLSFHERLELPPVLLISNRADNSGTGAATAISSEDEEL